jgi:hypothetical protein
MDNIYLPNSKILGTTIIILTHEIRIHTLISSNQNTELSVYKCEFESCIRTLSVSISITGIEVVIKGLLQQMSTLRPSSVLISNLCCIRRTTQQSNYKWKPTIYTDYILVKIVEYVETLTSFIIRSVHALLHINVIFSVSLKARNTYSTSWESLRWSTLTSSTCIAFDERFSTILLATNSAKRKLEDCSWIVWQRNNIQCKILYIHIICNTFILVNISGKIWQKGSFSYSPKMADLFVFCHNHDLYQLKAQTYPYIHSTKAIFTHSYILQLLMTHEYTK